MLHLTFLCSNISDANTHIDVKMAARTGAVAPCSPVWCFVYTVLYLFFVLVSRDMHCKLRLQPPGHN